MPTEKFSLFGFEAEISPISRPSLYYLPYSSFSCLLLHKTLHISGKKTENKMEFGDSGSMATTQKWRSNVIVEELPVDARVISRQGADWILFVSYFVPFCLPYDLEKKIEEFPFSD